jgi:hypothetical protein
MRKMKNVCKIVFGVPEGKAPVQRLIIDGRAVLNCFLG